MPTKLAPREKKLQACADFIYVYTAVKIYNKNAPIHQEAIKGITAWRA